MVAPGDPPTQTINIHEARKWCPHHSQVKLLYFDHFFLSHIPGFRPHFGLPRKIHKGQKIHSSCLWAGELINGQPYIPKARPVGDDPGFWNTARADGLGDWLELDLYEYIDNLVKGFVEHPSIASLEDLHRTAVWGKPILSVVLSTDKLTLYLKLMGSK